MQGLLRVSSQSVAAALEERLRPAQFTVVLPTSWRRQKCGVEFQTPKGQTRYKVSGQTNILMGVCKSSNDQQAFPPGSLFGFIFDYFVN